MKTSTMDDVASVKNENANLRKIQNKLLQWDVLDNPLAPLTQTQKDVIYTLSQLMPGSSSENKDKIEQEVKPATETTNEDHLSSSLKELKSQNDGIDSLQNFMFWYDRVDYEILGQEDDIHLEYYDQLKSRDKECDCLLSQIDSALDALNNLNTEFEFVSNNTSSLHTASEKLIQDQNKFNEIEQDIKNKLHYFTNVELISQKLQNPTISVAGDSFWNCLNQIDEGVEYLRMHQKFKDSAIYIVKYRQCLARAAVMMKSYVTQILATATEQVLAPRQTASAKSETPKITDKSSDAAFALYYGKFQASAPKVKKITALIEERKDRNSEYEQLLMELQQNYLSQRATVMSPGVDAAIKDLTSSHKGDHCALVRSSCAFLVHVCQDEHRLFYQFFPTHNSQLTAYMEGLCIVLYDTLRPYIIHINHLETLAEICSILRIEMLDEHVQHNPESLEAFGKIVYQLLQDVQERLVFRAHLYLQSDILNYKPSAGDLAYPEKLEMMESIALSLQEPPNFMRSDSRSSMFSMTSQEVEHINSFAENQMRSRTGNSPADLHGMWYPTVRRTLVCLSRLYRCVDRPIFQGLSQEALTHCIQSVSVAAQAISQRKTPIDGELFEIKHLLILREQIAPFRVDFTVKETSLDFSKVKTAAFSLLQKRRQLFALGSNNALLEFLLEGAPQVKEHLLDSRKDVDRQLKTVCEIFIKDATILFIGNVINFMERAQTLLKQSSAQQGMNQSKVNLILRNSPWASPQQISGIIQESQRNIKTKLSGLQRSMQLYLANKDTEFILFRPIRNNIIGSFVKLEQLLTTNDHYTKDDLVIAGCPSADQISVLLSASVLAENSSIGGPPLSQPIPSRKTTLSSVENEKIVEEQELEIVKSEENVTETNKHPDFSIDVEVKENLN